MKTLFQDLLTYTYHSNQTMIELMERSKLQIPEKCLATANHILLAQKIWNNRIEGISDFSFKLWKPVPIQRLIEYNNEEFQKSMYLLEKNDLYSPIHYSNTKGHKFSNSFKEILFHVVNHSTYHRGQVIIQLKEAGIEVESTDYIFWKRKQV
jgi:uncharacterized damage-inducible protein DinB